MEPSGSIMFLNVNKNIYIKKRIMRFREFEIKIRPLPAFNLNDVRKIDPGFHRQQLNTWLRQGYIQPLAGCYYALAEQQVDEMYLFVLANRIYQPSYVSLESALAYYAILPETVFGVTSVSARKTKQFESARGVFSYRSMSPHYMIGYQVVEPSPGYKFKIALLEKAILDYLYLNTDIRSTADFEELRWNQAQLLDRLDASVFAKFINIIGKRSLISRANTFLEYLGA